MTNLVLLPGLLCDEAVWKDQVAALSDIASCTIPDYGLTNSLPGMAELVLKIAPRTFALAGHSMGGRVAMEVLRQAPHRVERIALMNTGSDPRKPGQAGEDEAKRRMALVDLSRTEGMRAMGRVWLPPMINAARANDTVLVDSILGMLERRNPDIFFAQQTALINRPDATPVLQKIQVPALLLSGREDVWSPPVRHEEMAAKIKGSRVAIIPDSGHMSTMEQPALVSEALRAWLQS